MRLLDLYAGPGGAGEGYRQAGWDVVGIEIYPHWAAMNPGHTIVGDVTQLTEADFEGFDAVHASPPCHRWTKILSPEKRATKPDLIAFTRDLLDRVGLPYVIENVPGAPVRHDLRLCGSMFGLRTETGLQLQRHRYFELSGWTLDEQPPPCAHTPGATITVTGKGTPKASQKYLGRTVSTLEFQQAMQMPWASQRAITQAIPPAYTRWIGERLAACITSS